jgi:hypothetical protein
VSSSEGCRIEKLADIKAGAGPAFSYDNGQGLIAWAEGFDTYDLHVLRFSVDENDESKPVTNNSGPVLVLETQQPTQTDDTLEYFFGLDVRSDYSAVDPVELVAIYSLIDFANGSGERGQERSIRVLDLNAASITPNVVWSITSNAATDCIGDGPSFDPRLNNGHLCMVPDGGVDFSQSGSHIYFHSASTVGPFDDRWHAQNRLARPQEGWVSGSSSPELLYTSQIFDCVADAMPFADDSMLMELPGQGVREVFVANACVGFQKGGLRDQRLYFLDVEACAVDSDSRWQNCHIDISTLYSGQIHGRGASWRDDGEVLYGGFESKTLDSIRAFDPMGAPAINDREIVSQGETPDSSL